MKDIGALSPKLVVFIKPPLHSGLRELRGRKGRQIAIARGDAFTTG